MGSSVTVIPPSAWRPPQWSHPPLVLVTVPRANVSNIGDGEIQGADQASGVETATIRTTIRQATSYVFDAVIAAEHSQTLVKTMHPVQTSVSISSHAYLEPATLVLNVLMSDVVANQVLSGPPFYIQPWSGNRSKSVSAYQQMLTLQAIRVPLTVTTRLRTYTNMLITSIAPKEDAATIGGARFRVEFGQIFIADVQDTEDSVRPNDTQSNDLGTVNPQDVPTPTQAQYGVQAFGPGGNQPNPPPLPPDLGNGTMPVVQNGVPGYLPGPNGGPVSPATPAPDIQFVPQYPNSVVATNVPGAGGYASNPVQTNSLATGVN